jgi:hypothetical protein
MRIPREVAEQHQFIPGGRVSVGSTHRYGVTVPAMRYPWRCSCGAEGRQGGRNGEYGSHRDHVEAEARRQGIAR